MLFGVKQETPATKSAYAKMNDMKTTTRSAVPTGNGLMLPRLASAQLTDTPADKSAGGGLQVT